jgi:hypothetical protein
MLNEAKMRNESIKNTLKVVNWLVYMSTNWYHIVRPPEIKLTFIYLNALL